jgi:hypothetical protein
MARLRVSSLQYRVTRTMLSSPAQAGDPVRRGFSILSLTSLEYRVTRGG